MLVVIKDRKSGGNETIHNIKRLEVTPEGIVKMDTMTGRMISSRIGPNDVMTVNYALD